MTATAASDHRGRIPGWIASLALLWLTWNGTPAQAQVSPLTSAPPPTAYNNSIGTDVPAALPAPAPAPLTPVNAQVEQPPLAQPIPTTPEPNKIPPATAPISGVQLTGCSSCANGLAGIPPPDMDHDGQDWNCPDRPCHAGRQPANPCLADCWFGRCLCALYECICYPDPCYEGKWTPISDAAFFTDCARPQTQQRFVWDLGLGLTDPDRAEYFWARADGMGKGPSPVAPFKGPLSVRYNQVSMYTEAGSGAAAVTFTIPYERVDPEPGAPDAGFGDMTIGTKALLFDCELLQITFEMNTTMPAGNFNKGLGDGHVSLEPMLIFGLKLGADTYMQAEVGEWIPIGGDTSYEGSILQFNISLNQVLFRCLKDVPIIGTLELNTWSFQDGAYTDPLLGSFQKASGMTYVAPAVGIRLFVCDKCDFGFAAEFAVTQQHFADQLYRTEFRFRF